MSCRTAGSGATHVDRPALSLAPTPAYDGSIATPHVAESRLAGVASSTGRFSSGSPGRSTLCSRSVEAAAADIESPPCPPYAAQQSTATTAFCGLLP